MISSTQREILETLIEIYQDSKGPIKAEEIADTLNRTSGTIRNQMSTLRVLGFVDAILGPKGGYIPGNKAYELLGIELTEASKVNIYRGGRKVKGVNVHRILFKDVDHAEKSQLIVSVLGDTKRIAEKDTILIGPTHLNHILLRGTVVGRDDIKRELLIDLESMSSIPKGKVREIASRNLIHVDSKTSVKECCKIFIEKGIKGMPVIDNGRLVGILTLGEVVRAVAKGKTNLNVGRIAVKKVITIDLNSSLLECMKRMEEYDIGRLIVMDGKKPTGIITRTDVLHRFTG